MFLCSTSYLIAQIVLVVDCPTLAHLDQLVASELFEDYLKNEKKLVKLVIHMTPNNILENGVYHTAMARLGDDVQVTINNNATNINYIPLFMNPISRL